MKRKELLDKLTAACKRAGSPEARNAEVLALLDEETKIEEAEELALSGAGKPKTENLTAKDVMKLLDERDKKTREYFEAKLAGRSEMEADRTLPFEIRDAELAAHAYGIETLSLDQRMTMTSRDLSEAGIIDRERDLTLSSQRLAGRLYLAGQLMRKDPRAFRRYGTYRQALAALNEETKGRQTRAMDEFTPGEGAEWVPVRWTGILLERVEQALVIAALFPHFTMVTKDETVGLSGARPVMYHLGQWPLSDNEAAIPASTPGTDDLTFHAKDMYIRLIYGTNWSEDSAFRSMEIIERDMIQSARRGIDDAFLNGDTAGALDTGFDYTLHPRLAFEGIRKVIGSGYKYDVTSGATAFTSTDLDEIKLLMGQPWGGDVTRLVYLTSMLGSTRINQFSDVRTVTDMGPQAVLMRGQLGEIGNVPILQSEFIGRNFNASGIYDGVTQTYTILICVNRDAFIVGDRKDITMESGKIIEKGQMQLVLTWRGAFERRYGTTEPGIAALGYKIA